MDVGSEDEGGFDLTPEDLGLCYTTDEEPGILRRRHGKGFSYTGPDGKVIRDRQKLAWIRSLAIPPAWRQVWISPRADGHLLATGRDARGRKQYRYHPDWRAVRESHKFGRLAAFAAALPAIRARTMADLGTRGLGRGKVLALVVRLLDETLVRVGNREYARANRSFGLTTLRRRHLRVEGADIKLTFRGKGGKEWRVALHSRRMAGLVRRLQELPGQELFRYLDEDGTAQRIDSADVNAYLREVAGAPFTAKDFRTWWATVLACRELMGLPPATSETEARRLVAGAIKVVAQRLGNTPAVCRRSYVHPLVIERWAAGGLAGLEAGLTTVEAALRDELSEDELRALALLQSGLEAAEALPPAERGQMIEKVTAAAEIIAS